LTGGRGVRDDRATMSGPVFLPTWTAMMAAMMLPSAAPLFRLEHAIGRSWLRTSTVVGGYLAVWAAAGCVVLAGDALVDGRLLGMHGRRFGAALLVIAALYQALPAKSRCLTRCRSPLAQLAQWRDGLRGAARLGAASGLWCAGCCAGLMVALLALGVMDVRWMVVVGVVVAVEKLTPVGVAASRLAAVVLAAGALVWAL
jgi:predicted metal-binding membrane protein